MITYTAKAISNAPVKQDSGAVAFGAHNRLYALGKNLLNSKSVGYNGPQEIDSTFAVPFIDYNFFDPSNFIILQYTNRLGYVVVNHVIRSCKYTTKPINNMTQIYSTNKSDYNAITGEPNSVVSRLDNFGRDDAQNNEFVFIASNKGLVEQDNDSSLYYTY